MRAVGVRYERVEIEIYRFYIRGIFYELQKRRYILRNSGDFRVIGRQRYVVADAVRNVEPERQGCDGVFPPVRIERVYASVFYRNAVEHAVLDDNVYRRVDVRAL